MLKLSMNNHTPLSEWKSMPLWELRYWIKANNAVIAEGKEAADGE